MRCQKAQSAILVADTAEGKGEVGGARKKPGGAFLLAHHDQIKTKEVKDKWIKRQKQ